MHVIWYLQSDWDRGESISHTHPMQCRYPWWHALNVEDEKARGLMLQADDKAWCVMRNGGRKTLHIKHHRTLWFLNETLWMFWERERNAEHEGKKKKNMAWVDYILLSTIWLYREDEHLEDEDEGRPLKPTWSSIMWVKDQWHICWEQFSY